jgi:hypothetical protein
MTFSELIRLSNQLEQVSVQDLSTASRMNFEQIMQKTDVPDSGIHQSYRQKLCDKNQELEKCLTEFEQEINKLKEQVKLDIEREGMAWLQKSYSAYEKQLETKDAQQPYSVGLHRNKPIQLDAELDTLYHTRVKANSDWHYPAIIIHPMLESFIHDMAGSDPLYLVDESHYLLEPTLTKFNPTYKNRLRPYVIEESFDQSILHQLPDEQFGYCLVYNYLDYRPFEMIQKYLSEVYQKLLPGGVLAMTFNDCDRFQALQSVEQYITCYTPGSLVKSWAHYVGYEIIYEHRYDSATCWIEFKKPGKLNSIRGGQCLAKIKPKSVAKSK